MHAISMSTRYLVQIYNPTLKQFSSGKSVAELAPRWIGCGAAVDPLEATRQSEERNILHPQTPFQKMLHDGETHDEECGSPFVHAANHIGESTKDRLVDCLHVSQHHSSRHPHSPTRSVFGVER